MPDATGGTRELGLGVALPCMLIISWREPGTAEFPTVSLLKWDGVSGRPHLNNRGPQKGRGRPCMFLERRSLSLTCTYSRQRWRKEKTKVTKWENADTPVVEGRGWEQAFTELLLWEEDLFTRSFPHSNHGLGNPRPFSRTRNGGLQNWMHCLWSQDLGENPQLQYSVYWGGVNCIYQPWFGVWRGRFLSINWNTSKVETLQDSCRTNQGPKPRFKLAVRPWMSHFSSLSLCFLLWKM